MTKKFTFWLGFTSLLVSTILTLVILIFFRFLPSKLPLFYSLAWGEGQLATHTQFLIIPTSIILVTLLNFTVSSQLHCSQNFFKVILCVSSYTVTLILLITFVKICLMFT